MAKSILASGAKHLQFGSAQRIAIKPVSIYGLADPETGELRYVGKTVSPLRHRLKNHLGDASRNKSTYRSGNWLRAIISKGLKPDIFEIELVPTGGDWVEAEMHWIAVMRSLGANLTNVADGGQGTEGYKFNDAQLKVMSDSHRGIKRSPETIAKYQEVMRLKKLAGWKKPQRTQAEIDLQFATRKKNREAGLFKKRVSATDETRLKISEAKKRDPKVAPMLRALAARRVGVPLTEDHRRKVGEAGKGRKQSDETKLLLSKLIRAAWERRRLKAASNHIQTTLQF